MTRFVLRSASFILTFLIGIFLASIVFRANSTALNQSRFNDIELPSKQSNLDSLKSRPGCGVLDKNNPPLYISYERIQERMFTGEKKPEKAVVLRLKNNTSCSIFVYLYNPPDTSELEDSEVLKDGSFASVEYKVHNPKDLNTSTRSPEAKDEASWVGEIKRGRSSLFISPLKFFKAQFEMQVDFYYPWEIGTGQKSPDYLGETGNVGHQLFFYYWFLPKEVLEKN